MSATRSSDSVCHGIHRRSWRTALPRLSFAAVRCIQQLADALREQLQSALAPPHHGRPVHGRRDALLRHHRPGPALRGWPAPRTALCMGEPERQCRGCQRERPCTEHKTGSHAKRCLHFSSLAHMKILAAEGSHRRR
nr:uncharacterized protein LOC119165104 [Rhipicephalus microplus]